jgi:hypothetical protein
MKKISSTSCVWAALPGRRHEHDAQREVLGGNVATVGLAGGAVTDEAVLRARDTHPTRASANASQSAVRSVQRAT